MPRLQVLTSGAQRAVTVAGTAVPLSLTSKLVTSVTIQALPGNTGYMYVGDSTGQLQAIEPGRSMVVWGDGLDNGTTAFFDLADIYVDADVNNEAVTYTYLDGY